MVAERDFVCADFFCLVVERAAAHFAAQTARVGFFTDVEQDFAYIRRDDVIRHAEFFGVIDQSLYLVLISPFEAQIDRYSRKREAFGGKPLVGF